MTNSGQTSQQERSENALKMAIAGIVGQVGCLTLVIITIALIAGLWLDNQLETRPLFTLVFILGSIPVTLYLMVRLVLAVAPKLEISSASAVQSEEKENAAGGEHSGDEEA
jgi:hypothetical protein